VSPEKAQDWLRHGLFDRFTVSQDHSFALQGSALSHSPTLGLAPPGFHSLRLSAASRLNTDVPVGPHLPILG